MENRLVKIIKDDEKQYRQLLEGLACNITEKLFGPPNWQDQHWLRHRVGIRPNLRNTVFARKEKDDLDKQQFIIFVKGVLLENAK